MAFLTTCTCVELLLIIIAVERAEVDSGPPIVRARAGRVLCFCVGLHEPAKPKHSRAMAAQVHWRYRPASLIFSDWAVACTSPMTWHSWVAKSLL